jgi:hypothetical protein
MGFDLPQPIAVVCHDAGATNLILPWLEDAGLNDAKPAILPVMEGPAAQLWAQAFPQGPAPMPLDQAMAQAASVLSGTGWQSDLEHRARIAARTAHLPSAAVIDHWVNYPERFERGGETVLPDELWVCDADAEALAQRTFALPVRRQPNRFIERQVAEIGPLPQGGGDVLYVAEPARDDWGRGAQGEFQALDFFLAGRAALGINGLPVRLRPHPSDPPGKWVDWLAGRSDDGLSLDTNQSLASAMAPASWVIGCQSFAMVVALAAGRSVASVLPPWAPPCALPQAGIVHLSEVLAH